LILDSGPEGAALDEPYANKPSFRGQLSWEPDDMIAVADAALKRGWRIATHAIGDRAVRTLIDVYERVLQVDPGLPPATLVVEHGFLADATQRARAIRLGIAVTIQHPLLYALGGQLVALWGPERTRQIMPVKAWVDEGALVSAGTDSTGSEYPVPAYAPLHAIWGMVTRQTAAVGVQGPEYAVDQYTAVQLYTTASAQRSGDGERRGRLQTGCLADLVAFRSDPITGPVEDLPALRPVFTLVGGRAVYDPDGLLPQQG
jgi:predicted amidohydrolase YtcJ